MLGHLELWVLGLLVAVAGLVMLSNYLRVPYPVLLVIGGLALGLVPVVPNVELPSDLILLIFLPPLLYSAAFFSSPRDLRANLRPIASLSIALVLLTTVTVAVVAHAVIGLPWAAAFVLGAIVSPTDPAAATAIAGRLGAPRRIVTILEGESLVNDGTALVLSRVAVAAVVTGTFSPLYAGLEFVLYGAGGTAIGLLAGWVISRVRQRIEDPLVEITISLVTPYAAYIPAEELGASGVLAVVAAGVYLGWRNPETTAPRTRLQAFSVWEALPFLLNSVLFILVGLQLPNVLESISGEYSVTSVLLYAALVILAVIGTRLVWTLPAAYLPRYLSRRLRERETYPPWRYAAVVAYTGMRGAVSLAAALAIPLTVQDGSAFPGRDLILFLTFCVILLTLVPQGLSLPFIIRRLGLSGAGGDEEREEIEARLQAAEAALEKIDELENEGRVRKDTAERMRDLYEYRRRRFLARLEGQTENGEDYEERSQDYQRFRRDLLGAERAALLQLRNEGRLSEEARRRVERDLDLEDARLEI
ncbi:MAG: Na+/H+ antiporter [Actinobacteria bacterium]|nr:Na+/H+ antiporter [Actinomycetota bacterium]